MIDLPVSAGTVYFGLAGVMAAILLIQEFTAERLERARLRSALESESNARKGELVARQRAEEILAATHHEVSRELLMVQFAIDDLEDDFPDLPLEELNRAVDKLVEGRDRVAALAQLGSRTSTPAVRPLRLEQIVVEDDEIAVEPVANLPGSVETISADRLLVRLLVRAAVRISRVELKASRVTVGLGPQTLVLEAVCPDGASTDWVDQIWRERGNDADVGTPHSLIATDVLTIQQVVGSHGAEIIRWEATAQGIVVEIRFPDAEKRPADETAANHAREVATANA